MADTPDTIDNIVELPKNGGGGSDGEPFANRLDCLFTDYHLARTYIQFAQETEEAFEARVHIEVETIWKIIRQPADNIRQIKHKLDILADMIRSDPRSRRELMLVNNIAADLDALKIN